MNSRGIYLDHNATTPVDPRVSERMRASLTEAWGNPASRDHAFGWDAYEAVEEARFHVANLIGATPPEIVFTSGTTESINHAIKGVVQAGQAGRPATAHVITSVVEHPAVLEVCRQLERTHGTATTYLSVDSVGRVSSDWQAALVPGRSCVAALTLADGEIGTVQCLPHMVAAARSVGAVTFSDLAQAAGKIPVNVRQQDIDLAAFSAHKMYGPKGVGALYIRGRPAIVLEPLVAGGGQEQGRRSGTLNVPGIVGFGEACRIALGEMDDEPTRLSALRDRLETALLDGIPDTWSNGDRSARLPNTANIGFAGVHARLLIRDLHDVAVSTQSACSSGSGRPSHVLKAIGLSDDLAYSCVRFSVGRFTTEEEIERAVIKVGSTVKKLRRAGGDAVSGRSNA
jgi:cysteine desulfurase